MQGYDPLNWKVHPLRVYLERFFCTDSHYPVFGKIRKTLFTVIKVVYLILSKFTIITHDNHGIEDNFIINNNFDWMSLLTEPQVW